MNKLILILSASIILFSGCTKYIEVNKEIAFFDYKKCKTPKKVNMGKTIFIGDDTNFEYFKGMFGDYTLSIIPNMEKRLDFNETMYSYPQSQLDIFIECYTDILVNYDKNKVIVEDHNSKVIKK